MKTKTIFSSTLTSFVGSVLTVLFVGSSAILNAQIATQIECGTTSTPEDKVYLDKNRGKLKKYENEYLNLVGNNNKNLYRSSRTSAAITSLPIKAHIIRNNDGTGGLSLTDLENAIDIVNEHYADIFVAFFICGPINYVDDSTLYDYQIEEEEQQFLDDHYVDGLINIIFTGSIYRTSNATSLCGNAKYPSHEKAVITMANSCMNNGSTFTHEFGHFFGLRHTHEDDNGLELVDGSNCDTAGDGFCDTPADPMLSGLVNTSCVYTGVATDANGDLYNPSVTNFMSYARKVCRVEFTLEQLARMYAVFITERNDFVCPSFHVSMTTDLPDQCVGENTTVNFTDLSVGAISWGWDVDGDDIIDYTSQNPSHLYVSDGVYDVALTISNGTDTITKVYPELIAIGAQKSVTYSESFDTFWSASFDGWKTVDVNGNGYNWTINSGTTPSSGSNSVTGPAGDNSGNPNGQYIYTEASDSEPGDVAEYVSPCILINSSDAELSFAYHMFGNGSHMGDLHVDIDSGTGFINDVIPSFSGNQQSAQVDPYLWQIVDLSPYANQTIRIRFRAVRGTGWRGDMAIDDIGITGSVLSVNDLHFDEVIFSPNPATSAISFFDDYLNSHFSIYSLSGNLVKEGTTTSSVDVSSLQIGAYFLRVTKDDKMVTKKLIIE